MRIFQGDADIVCPDAIGFARSAARAADACAWNPTASTCTRSHFPDSEAQWLPSIAARFVSGIMRDSGES